MEEPDLATCAKGLAGALRAMGSAPREQVLDMLAALHVPPGDRQAVIDYALAHGIFVADGDDLRPVSPSGTIRAVREGGAHPAADADRRRR